MCISCADKMKWKKKRKDHKRKVKHNKWKIDQKKRKRKKKKKKMQKKNFARHRMVARQEIKHMRITMRISISYKHLISMTCMFYDAHMLWHIMHHGYMHHGYMHHGYIHHGYMHHGHICVGRTAWAPEGREGRSQGGPKGQKEARRATD